MWDWLALTNIRLGKRVEYSPMACETGIQSQVESYEKLKKTVVL